MRICFFSLLSLMFITHLLLLIYFSLLMFCLRFLKKVFKRPSHTVKKRAPIGKTFVQLLFYDLFDLVDMGPNDLVGRFVRNICGDLYRFSKVNINWREATEKD